MNSEERKQRFVVLLRELLNEYGGTKNKLAESLRIKPSTLTPWLQGNIDPAALDILTFDRLAKVKGCSTDELATLLKLKQERFEKPLDKLRTLVTEMLEGLSQEQLGRKLGISRNTIRGWLNPSKNIDPNQIPAGTISNLAVERGWTIERLLAYLGLKKFEEIEEDLLAKIQSLTVGLSLANQIKLQSWVSLQLENELKKLDTQILIKGKSQILSDRKLCVVIEEEDIAITSQYTGNLVLHLQLQPENIKIATPPSMPESLENFDVLIFDINSEQSPCIPLLESLEFKGDIVIFADSSIPEAISARLSAPITDLLIKPIPWKELKDQPYFSGGV